VTVSDVLNRYSSHARTWGSNGSDASAVTAVTADRVVIRAKRFWREREGREPEMILVGGWIGTAIDKAERAKRKNEGER
jgi:hypothetical protein